MKKHILLSLFILLYSIQAFSFINKDTIYNKFDNDLYEKVKSCLTKPYDSVFLFKMKNRSQIENKFATIYDNYINLFNLMHLDRKDFCNSEINQFYKFDVVKAILLNKQFYSESYNIGNSVYEYGDIALDPQYEFGLLLFKNNDSITFIAFSPNNMQFSIITTTPTYSLRIKGITLFERELNQIQEIFK